MEMMGQKTTEEEIFRMIAEADAESTGEISYSQFRERTDRVYCRRLAGEYKL